MKNKLLITSIALLFLGHLQLNAINDLAFKTTKYEIGEKINPEEFSLSSFAFTENKGQVFGYDGLLHPEVKYAFQQGNTQIFLLEKGIAYQFTKTHYPEGYQELIGDKNGGMELEKLTEMQKQIRTETFRMDMVLVGANKNAKISTEGESADFTNFYNHNILNVHSYSKITYHNIYPGIDWVIYTKGKELKYDFIVQPGADPSLIQLNFENQEGLKLNEDGSFTLTNKLGTITENSPVSFQNNKIVKTQFLLEKNTISFLMQEYDNNQTLIIDPAILWGTYYGGTGDETGFFSATDAGGNVYLSGTSGSNANIASLGHQNTYGGSYDAFLVKFNDSGVRQWATYYGGSGSDYGSSCAVDGTGNVYLCGSSNSNANIASLGQQNSLSGNYDAFLVKFNAIGVRQWGTYYGDPYNDYGRSCATDATGNVYLAGSTSGIPSSPNNIGSGGYQNVYGSGLSDGFLVKFNGNGVRQWGTFYGSNSDDYGNSCASDASGNIYLGGYTNSNTGIAFNGHQNSFAGSWDNYLVKFNSNGQRLWATYYGGTSGDYGGYCTTDVSGNVYLAGDTESTTGIASGGHQNTWGSFGQADGFLVKFNSSGVRQWGTYYGGSSADKAYSCSTDGIGNVYLVGQTTSLSDISSGGYQNTYGGASGDAFMVMFNGAGVRLWASYYGGTGVDGGYSLSHDLSGNIYLTGNTGSSSSISSAGHQNTIGGLNDAFLVKFCNTAVQLSPISGSTMACLGSNYIYSVTSNSAASNYSWTIPGTWTGSSTSNTISLTPSSSSVISVIAQNTCGVGAPQSLSIVVNPLPTIVFNNTLVSICAGESTTLSPTGANTYTWSDGSNGTSLIISPSISTSYSVTGANANGCENVASYTQAVDECTGIETNNLSSRKLRLYPNPNNGSFFIDVPTETNVVIVSATGKIVFETHLDLGVNVISLSNLAKGLYFINTTDQTDNFTYKLIIQ